MEDYLIHTGSFQVTQVDLIVRLLVAVGIGAVIGLEREHAAMQEKKESFAGIRTFVFLVLLGFMSGMGYYLLSPLVYIGVLLSVTLLTGISYWITARSGDIGATTEFTAIIVFFLGTLSFIGLIELSLMIMVLVVVLLSAKLRLRSLVGKISEEELYDFIRYVVVALLIFPFLPDEQMGPYGVLNPREIGWVVILTSGLGFLGYVLMRVLGPGRGILLSGLVGGLVSSTATTWIFARKSRENQSLSHSCAVAILGASSIMIIRVWVWNFIFNRELFLKAAFPMLLIFLGGIGVTLMLYIRQRGKRIEDAAIPGSKPLDLTGALVFGLLYAAILLLVSYANEHLGSRGILVSSGIAGLSDIDAISITVSKLSGVQLDFSTASIALIIATMSNTLVKMGIGIRAGSAVLRKDLYLGYGVMLVMAIVALVTVI